MIFDLITVSQRQKAKEWIDSLIPKIIEIKEYKPQRTSQANRYYWAILAFLQSETGEDKNRLHLIFREMFLEHRYLDIFKHQTIEIQSTTELDKKQFFDYCEKICTFVNTELSITIPSKDDEYFENFLTMYSDLI